MDAPKVKFILLILAVIVLSVIAVLLPAMDAGVITLGFGKGKKPVRECDDHIDNDGDGFCDFAWRKAYCDDGSIAGDSGCLAKDDNDETNCGDGVCEGGETQESCPEDCGYPTTTTITIPTTTTIPPTTTTIPPNATTTTVPPTTTITIPTTTVPPTTTTIPDSCSDTDGGFVITIQGTVSGYSAGVPYSHTDYCVDSITLNEYYCLGNSYDSDALICLNATTCSNGACV